MFRFMKQYCIDNKVCLGEYFSTQCIMCLITIGTKDMPLPIWHYSFFRLRTRRVRTKKSRVAILGGIKMGFDKSEGRIFFTYVDRCGVIITFLFKGDRTVYDLGTCIYNFVRSTKWSCGLSTFQRDSFGKHQLSSVVLK